MRRTRKSPGRRIPPQDRARRHRIPRGLGTKNIYAYLYAEMQKR
jgi:hypothetical protein